jgi:hypothetical protein
MWQELYDMACLDVLAFSLSLMKRQEARSLRVIQSLHERKEKAALAFGSSMFGMDTPRSILIAGM